MIHFVDQTSEGDHHMVFNAAMVKVLLEMYPHDCVTLHGIASNQASVRQLLTAAEKQRLRFQEIAYSKPPLTNKAGKAFNYIRKERRRKQHFKALFAAVQPTDLVFLSITTFTSFYAFVRLTKRTGVPTVACLHGDIDYLYYARNKHEAINALFHKKLMQKPPSNLKFVLLNKIAKKRLVDDGFLAQDTAMEIEHPYAELPMIQVRKKPGDGPVSFAHIGSMEAERKNSHYIFDLAKKLHGEIAGGSIRLEAIGLMTPSVLPYKNDLVKVQVGNATPESPRYLTREEYEHALNNAHYTLFFYPVTEYVFRASGATVDTISFAKPILTLRHPYFDYLFSVAGNVGYVFETLEQMENKIRDISQNPVAYAEEYEQQCKNLERFKERLTVKAVAADLKAQMEHLGIVRESSGSTND